MALNLDLLNLDLLKEQIYQALEDSFNPPDISDEIKEQSSKVYQKLSLGLAEAIDAYIKTASVNDEGNIT